MEESENSDPDESDPGRRSAALTSTSSVESRSDPASWGIDGPGVRLGFRQIKGFREEDARRIETSRARVRRFGSVDQFHRLTCLSRKSIERLAEADAFGSLSRSRRGALWHVMELH